MRLQQRERGSMKPTADEILREISGLLNATTKSAKADVKYATILQRITDTMKNQPPHIVAALNEVKTAARIIYESDLSKGQSDEERMAVFSLALSHFTKAQALANEGGRV
jgi:hypothetical protein